MANTITPSGPVARVLARVQGVRRNGTSWTARCPAHDDRTPSLSIAQGDDGRVLLKCHAGCTHKAIAAALGIEERELFPPTEVAATPSRPPREFATAKAAADAYRAKHGKESARWTYRDAEGKPIGLVMRWNRKNGTKDYRPVWRFGKRWRLTYPEVRPLYALDRLAAAPGGRVFVVEGEKCAEMLWTLGLPATTSPGGSNAARQGDWSPLTGRNLVALPDADEPGSKYAAQVMECLEPIDPPAKACTVALPGLRHREDVVEFVGRVHGGDLAAARKAIEELAEKELAKLTLPVGWMTIGELLADPGLMKPPETVPSGWHAFDRAQPFGGAERGTITILAAPPKCYKTFTMLRLARGFAERGHRVAWLAGEMRPHALARRMLCQYARIGQSALASEVMPPDLAERFGKALRDLDAKVEGRIALKRAPIGFADLRQAGESADVVFVDYLQMVQHPDPSIKGNERIEGTMAEMIGVATRTNAVFIVAAAQPADGAGADRTLFNCVRGSTSAAYSADAVYCAERPSPTVRDSGAPFSIEYRCLAHREGEEHSFEVAIDPRTGLIAEEGSP
jgi:hypothetical protein